MCMCACTCLCVHACVDHAFTFVSKGEGVRMGTGEDGHGLPDTLCSCHVFVVWWAEDKEMWRYGE